MEGGRLKYVLALVLLSIMQPTLQGRQTPSTAPLISTLQGVLMDVSGVPVPGVTVNIGGDHLTRKLLTNEKGEFKVELPQGLYRVSSDPWEGFIPATGTISKATKRWASFLPARRAAFRLPPASTININFILIDSKSVSVKYPGAKRGEHYDDGPTIDISCENISLPFLSSTLPEVSMQFGEKHEKGNFIDYRADLIYGGHSVFADPHPGVVLTYNTATIYANQIRFDKRLNKFKAGGNVVVEDGKQSIRAKHAEVEFKGSEPVLKLIR